MTKVYTLPWFMRVHCKAGHDLRGDNGSVQKCGRGYPQMTCRECNRLRAKAWRNANEHRLERRSPSAGKTLRAA